MKATGQGARNYNAKLQKYVRIASNRIKQAKEKGWGLTPLEVKRHVSDCLRDGRDKPLMWSAAFDEWLPVYEKEKRIKPNTTQSYRSAVRALKSFIACDRGCAELSESQLKPTVVTDLNTYLLQRHKGGLRASTANKYMGHLAALARFAVSRGLRSESTDPFQFWCPNKAIYKPKAYLTIEEVDRYVFQEYPVDSDEYWVLCTFLVAFSAGGMRIADVLRLRPCNFSVEDDQILLTYCMGKTGHIHRTYLDPAAYARVEPLIRRAKNAECYLFPPLNRVLHTEEDELRGVRNGTACINRMHEKLKVKVGIDGKLTTHCARHSFIELMRRRGHGVDAIQEMAANSSQSAMKHYLKTSGNMPSQATSRLFDRI